MILAERSLDETLGRVASGFDTQKLVFTAGK
jgi:hypothetical protein